MQDTTRKTNDLYNSEHAKELGNAVPKSPFFFLKPTSSYLANGGTIEIPAGCDVHHESKFLFV
jgi:acylpyruvate hydrolase